MGDDPDSHAQKRNNTKLLYYLLDASDRRPLRRPKGNDFVLRDALRELTATLKGGSMGTVSDRAGLVERLGTMVDAAAASHAEAGYAPDRARASAPH